MNDLEKNFISAVVYVHNHEDVILNYLTSIVTCLKQHFENSELIVVNDDSSDQTVNIIKEFKQATSDISISIIHLSNFHGVEEAMIAGSDLAIGDFVFEFDKCHIPLNETIIMDAYYKCLQGNDVVFVSSNKKGPMLASAFYRIFNNNVNQYKIYSDIFKVVSRRGINRINSLYKKIPYRKAVYANCGLHTALLTFNADTSLHTYSKDVLNSNIKVGITSLMLFTNVAFKVAAIITFFMMMVSLSTIVYVIYDIVQFGVIGSGWASLMAFMAFSFFAVFLLITIILKYLSIMLDLNFKNRKYLIESIEKL